MWTKVKRGYEPRKRRTTPAIHRTRSGVRQARLVLPAEYVTAGRADIYSDGNGKLGFRLHDAGEFALTTANKTSQMRVVSLPVALSEGLPYGTTDVTLTYDGDMLVLDKSLLTRAMAAE